MKQVPSFLLLLVYFLFLSSESKGQYRFQKAYGGPNSELSDCLNKSSSTLTTTDDGGFAICQSTFSFGTGHQRIYFLRLHPNGDTIATRTYSLSNNHCIGRSIFQLPGGDFIMGVEWGGPQGGIGLIRTNNYGDTIWTKRFNGTSINSLAPGYFGFPFSDGGFGAVGTVAVSGFYCAAIAKTDQNGQTIYSRIYQADNYSNLILYAASETHDGGMIATGIHYGVTLDIILMKIDAAGNEQWTKKYGGPYDDFGYQVKELPDHTFLVTGSYANDVVGVDSDAFLMKTDSAGNLIFSKTYGDTLFQWANSFDIHPVTGDITLCGNLQYAQMAYTDAYLLHLDSLGNYSWGQRYGGSQEEAGCSLAATPDGGFALCGFTKSFGSGLYDLYLVKTDGAGDAGCNTYPYAPPVNNVSFSQGVVNAQFVSPLIDASVPCTMAYGTTVSDICSNVGIEEQKPALINLFPVPADDYLNLSSNVNGNFSLHIYTSLGQEVFYSEYQSTAGSITRIPTRNFPPGIYFMRVITSEGISEKRFAVNR